MKMYFDALVEVQLSEREWRLLTLLTRGEKVTYDEIADYVFEKPFKECSGVLFQLVTSLRKKNFKIVNISGGYRLYNRVYFC